MLYGTGHISLLCSDLMLSALPLWKTGVQQWVWNTPSVLHPAASTTESIWAPPPSFPCHLELFWTSSSGVFRGSVFVTRLSTDVIIAAVLLWVSLTKRVIKHHRTHPGERNISPGLSKATISHVLPHMLTLSWVLPPLYPSVVHTLLCCPFFALSKETN